MQKKIPLGISDFKEIITKDYLYIDKSLFIKEYLENSAKVSLITRPRRFGKTLNMSMLKYFLSKCDENNNELFVNLQIYNEKHLLEYMNNYPVIFISFKDEKYLNWDDCFLGLKSLIKEEYEKYDYIIQSDIFDETQKQEYISIKNGTANNVDYYKSLYFLCKYLYKYYNQTVIILIDEYDVPINSGYIHNYYKEVISFMRTFIGSALKDNIYLEKSLITGVLRVAKESIFSGLNNLEVSTVLNSRYNKYFGFEESEVEFLLNYYNINSEISDVKKWYNGYKIGGKTVYNPWSLIQYAKNHNDIGIDSYWVNTADDSLIKSILATGNSQLKCEMESLLNGNTIRKIIKNDLIMNEIDKSSENIWSLLLYTGYLTYEDKEKYQGFEHYILKIPNFEIKNMYRKLVQEWFSESVSFDKFLLMLTSLTKGDTKTFKNIFKDIVLNSMSYYDPTGDDSERVYHAFVLGMLVALEDVCEVISNRESGYGRYDIMLIPRDINNLGVIIEFKKFDKDDEKNLEQAVQNALKQIKQNEYNKTLIQRGIKNILELGIAFKGKEVLIGENKYEV